MQIRPILPKVTRHNNEDITLCICGDEITLEAHEVTLCILALRHNKKGAAEAFLVRNGVSRPAATLDALKTFYGD